MLAGSPFDSLSYDSLSEVASEWIAHVEGHSSEGIAAQLFAGDMARADSVLGRLPMEPLWQAIRPRPGLETALTELYLMAALRPHVLAYLSVQEGRALDGADSEAPHASRLMRDILRRVGRHPQAVASRRWGPLRLRVHLDPLLHLRRSHLILVRSRRHGAGLSAREHACLMREKALFRLRCGAIRLAIRQVRRYEQHDLTATLRSMASHGPYRQMLAFYILLLFPCARKLTNTSWGQLIDSIADYFIPKLDTLREVLPVESLRDHGIVKLMKIAFGVITARVANRDLHEPNDIEFILNTLRLSYSWGLTYPLVDNVMDSKATPGAVRDELADGLLHLFRAIDTSGDALPQSSHPVVRETFARVGEALELIPSQMRPAARHSLLMLLESHRRDAQRRLSSWPEAAPPEAFEAVWSDSVLKAACIRIATLTICGQATPPDSAARQLMASLLNQLGDDLWDLHSDLAEDRVTPFTLWAAGHSVRDPFRFFLDYVAVIATDQPTARRVALAIGVQETVRCFEEECDKRPGRVSEEARRKLSDALGAVPFAWDPERAPHVPHVDPDAVLFAIEEAFLQEIGGSGAGARFFATRR